MGSPRGLPETSGRWRVQTFPEGRCPCYLRIAPRPGEPFEKGSLHPAETSGGDDDDDGDDVFDTAPALVFIVTIVTYRHPSMRRSWMKLPALLRLLVYST